jgi:hypothetical protein
MEKCITPIMFSNTEAILTLHKEGLKGVCKDFVIKFNHDQRQIENIIPIAFDIVKAVIDEFHLKNKSIKGRLLALVCYVREGTDDEVKVYHPSYQSEIIDDTKDFFTTHMLKIAQRIDDFNQRGSNLLIKNIPEIHLHVTCIN